MIIKNVSSRKILLIDLPEPFNPAYSVELDPGVEKTVYDDDASKSLTLNNNLVSGTIIKTGSEEPMEDKTGYCLIGRFTDLKDSPTALYCNNKGNAVIVNAAGDGLDYAVFAGSDEKVGIVSGDIPGYLCTKICAGPGVSLSTCGTTNKCIEISMASSENLWDCTCGCVVPHTCGDKIEYLTHPSCFCNLTLADKCYVDTCVASVTSNQIVLEAPADSSYTGSSTCIYCSGYSSSALDLVFMGGSSKWLAVDATSVTTAQGLLGIALEAKTDCQAMLVALPGSFVRDESWNWTPGATLYAGETPGTMQEAIPTGADAVVKVVGFAMTAKVIFFNSSPDQQTVVA